MENKPELILDLKSIFLGGEFFVQWRLCGVEKGHLQVDGYLPVRGDDQGGGGPMGGQGINSKDGRRW